MNRDKPAQSKESKSPAVVRRLAEEKLKKHASAIKTPGDAESMLHELEVHQIELEMQNEELRKTQQEAEASRERYYDFYDLAPVGYFTLDAKGLIQESNLTAATLLGVERGALVKRPFTRFIVKEDHPAYLGRQQQLFETGERQVCRFRMQRAGSDPFWVRLEATATKDVDGRPLSRTVISDITERKRAEDALAASERKYRLLHVSMRDAFASVDMAGRIQEANRAYQEMLGYSEAELMQLTYTDLTPEKWHAFEAGIVEKQILPLGYSEVYEKEYRKKDGTIFPVELRTFLIRDDDGKPAAMWAIVRDLAEKKKVEEALRRSLSRQEALLAAVPDIIMEVDSHKKYTWANPAGLEFFGEDVVGKEAAFYFEGEQKTYDAVAPLFNGDERSFYVESWQRRRDGEKRLLAWWCRTLKDTHGAVTGALSTARDITESKRAEEELRQVLVGAHCILWRALVKQQPDGTMRWDLRISNEEAAENILPHLKGSCENYSASWHSQTLPEDLQRIHRTAAQALRDGKRGYSQDFRCRTSNGEIRWISEDANIQRLGAGRWMVIGVSMDISERKRAEEAVRQSEERFSTAFRSSPVAIAIARTNDSRLIDVNAAWEKMTGCAREEAIGRTSIELGLWVDSRDRDRIVSALREQRTAQGVEFSMRRKSGEIAHGLMSAEVVRMGDDECLLTMAVDITERKVAEALLQEGRLRYEAIFESTGAATLLVEEDGTILMANGECLPTTGYSPAELFGTKWPRYVAPDSLEMMLKHHNARREDPGKAPRKYEVKLVNKRGEIRNVILDIGMIPGTKRSVVSMLDITERKLVEQAWRESEEKYRVLTETTPDIIWQLGLDLRFIYVNSAIQKVLGYTAEELVGRSIAEFFAEDRLRQVQEIIAQELQDIQKHTGVVFETEMIHKSGRVVPLEIHGMIQKDANGKPIGFQGVTRDIAERKRADEALRASAALLSNALKMAHAGHWEYDVGSDTFTFNDNFYRIFRTTAQQVGGYTMSSKDYAKRFCHPDDAAMVGNETRAALEVADPNFTRQIEHRILYADGEVGFMTVRFFIVKDSQGRTVKTYGVNQDITERKRAEELVRESRELLAAVLNSIPVRVFWKDRNLVYLGCNTPFARDAGFEKPEDLIGKDDHAMSWREQADVYRADDRAVIESGEAKLLYEEVQTTPSGERIHLLTSKLPLRDAGGRIVGVLGTYHDISKLRHAEEELNHVLSSARCILWHAVATAKAGGGLDWDLRISNEEAAEALLPQARAPGQSYSDVWHNGTPREDLDEMDRLSEQAMREGKSGYTQEFRCRILNGESRWLSEDARIQPLGPGRWLVIGVCTDITSRREAQEKTTQQLDELRRWHEVTIGREERIAELKREANGLLSRLGEPPRYGGPDAESRGEAQP